MFSQVSVCPRGGVSAFGRGCLPYPPGQTPPGQTLPWADTPPAQCMVGYGQQAGGTHTTGMHSCT